MKKIFLLSLAVGVSCGAMADSYNPADVANAAMTGSPVAVDSTMLAPASASSSSSSTHKNHFYAGAGAGGIGMSNIWTNTASTSFTGPGDNAYKIDFNNQLTIDSGNIGWDTTFFAGYAWYLPKRTFLAVEIFDNVLNTAADTDEHPETVFTEDSVGVIKFARDLSVSMTMQNVYGLRALPGYQVTNDVVVYGIVGWARARVESNATYSLIENDSNHEIVYPGASESGEYDFNGYQLGLGTMINLTEHLAIRGDLIYTAYDTVTLNSGVDVDPDGSTNTMNITSDLTTLEANVSLVYMFG